jgi:HAD superfamily hydrolase (TIGR01509 family)
MAAEVTNDPSGYGFLLGCGKPHAAFFAGVAQRLGCHGTDLLFFDDQLANVEGARAAGWRAELFTDLPTLRRDLERHTGWSVP